MDFLNFYRSVVVVRTLLQSRSQSRPNRPAPYSGTTVTNRTLKTDKIVTICKQVSLEPPQDRCTAWPDLKVQQDKNPLISPTKKSNPKTFIKCYDFSLGYTTMEESEALAIELLTYLLYRAIKVIIDNHYSELLEYYCLNISLLS